MTKVVAFLRGVNLGARKVLSPDLRAAFAELGYDARTLLASGNVLFEADPDEDLRLRIERQLAKHFGFEIGTVLRTGEALQAMVESDPFAGRRESPDLKLYVTLLAHPVGRRADLPEGVPGDYRAVRVDDLEIYHEAYRMPTGRYGLGASAIGKALDKHTLWTNRNWNTIVRAAALC